MRTVTTDEGPRADTTAAKIGGLKPAFKPDGIISAGSSSQITDGAPAVLLASEQQAKALGKKPRARIVAHTQVGVDHDERLGPIPATRKVLERAGLSLDKIDLFEVNEASPRSCSPGRRIFGVDLSKVNVNGGAIALGHLLGARRAPGDDAPQRARAPAAALRPVTMCTAWACYSATIIGASSTRSVGGKKNKKHDAPERSARRTRPRAPRVEPRWDTAWPGWPSRSARAASQVGLVAYYVVAVILFFIIGLARSTAPSSAAGSRPRRRALLDAEHQSRRSRA